MAASTISPFQPEIESVNEFLQRFQLQNLQTLQATSDDAQKAAMLCRALPVNIITDIQRRLKPTVLTAATYSQIEENLKAQFEVKKSVIGSAVKFISRKQKANESIETYAKILNDLASQCDYSDCCRDRLLRDIFVSGLYSPKLISTLLQECETKKFHECVERAKIIEQLASDAADIKPEAKLLQFKLDKSGGTPYSVKSTNKVPGNYLCIRCGAQAKHYAQNCFALKLKCRKCKKEGHLAKVCRSKKVFSTSLGGNTYSREVLAQRESGEDGLMTSQIAMTQQALPKLCTERRGPQFNDCSYASQISDSNDFGSDSFLV